MDRFIALRLYPLHIFFHSFCINIYAYVWMRLMEFRDESFGFCLQGNTMKLLWTYGEKDPDFANLKWHGTFSGVRSIHMLTPMWKKPTHASNSRDARQWDVTVTNVSVCFFLSLKWFFFCVWIFKVLCLLVRLNNVCYIVRYVWMVEIMPKRPWQSDWCRLND